MTFALFMLFSLLSFWVPSLVADLLLARQASATLWEKTVWGSGLVGQVSFTVGLYWFGP